MISKTTKKIINVIIQIVLVLMFVLLLLAIYCRIQMMITKSNYATVLGYTVFQVASGSMEPELSIDDVIVVKKTNNIAVNDIISFESNDDIITHRVISINGDLITVKGDANNTIDSPIGIDCVIGKVIKVFPELKMWQEIFSDPKILVSLFITLLLFDFAFSYKKKESKDKHLNKENNEEISLKKGENIENNIGNRDIIENEDLLNLTRRIDLSELNDILEKENFQDALEQDEKDELYKTVINLSVDEIKEYVLPEVMEKEEHLDNYTIRLDLEEIQKKIKEKMK